MPPTISVLMPVYNVERYIREAMDGVLEQTYRDFEVVVVDDCSTDRTPSIIEEYAGHDRRVRLVRTPRNLGHTGALNQGLDECRGALVARMDGDDIMQPDRLAHQAAYLDDHPECAALGTQVDFIDADGDLLVHFERPLEHDEIDRRLLRGDCLAIVHPSVMYRREAVISVGKYDPSLQKGEDHDLFLRLAERARLANLPDTLLKFRRHHTSTTALSSGEAMMERTRQTIRRALVRRGMPADSIETDSFPQAPTRAEWHAQWAFSIYKRKGDSRVARKHALRALRHGPLNRRALRAFVYVFLGRTAGDLLRIGWRK